VREGGLLLPRGTVELEPRLQYTYRGSDALGIVFVGGAPQVAQQDVKRSEIEASLGMRVGLPWSLQADLRVPYTWLHQSRVIGSSQGESERESGRGDIEIGLTKQLLAERSSRPSVLASLTWKSASGRNEPNQLSPGSGFHQLQGGFTAVKRQDPLVFFGSWSYAATLARMRDGSKVDPGDSVGIKGGALLAASPETSLRAGFDLSWFGRTKVGGVSIPGTDGTVAVLELGFASLLNARTLFDLHFGIGLTPDAPDFRLRVSLPIRF
jgi:hypothetical protein